MPSFIQAERLKAPALAGCRLLPHKHAQGV